MSARSNGLSASAFSILLEIEESLGDRMLQALAERQIAAYVLPTPGPGGTTRLLLHVDSQRRVPAGIVLAGLTPAPAGELPSEGEPAPEAPSDAPSAVPDEQPAVTGLFDDAAFAEIVAGFHREPTDRSWPDAEDLPPEAEQPPATGPQTTQPYAGIDRRRPSISLTPDTRADRVEREEDEEERYIPAPLPRLDPPPPLIRWAFAGLFLGLALLILPSLFALGHRTSLDIAGVLCVLGSTAVLLSRLREHSSDDPNDGAVV
jgi:hypothetical protein